MKPKAIAQIWRLCTDRSAPAVVVGTGFALAIFLGVLRIAILWSVLKESSALEAPILAVQGCQQDWTLVLVLVLATLLILRVVSATRPRKAMAVFFLLLGVLLLLWGMVNVVSVRMLGEPVTLGWIQYSDILNSSYALEAVMHFVTPGMVLSVATAVIAFVAVSLAFAALFDRWPASRTHLTLLSAPILILFVAFFVPADGIGAGGKKVANPVFAFVQSLTAGQWSAPSLTNRNAATPIRQLVGTATPVPRPPVKRGQIRNVVFFVLESMPAKYAQGFGGTYPVTPNLLKYAAMGHRFTSTYAHAPASNYSLVSLMGAIVPELSPHSMTYSYPDLKFEAIASVLASRGFRSGYFSSSDNGFQNTAAFLDHTGFGLVQDHTDWPCDLGVYETDYDYLDTANDLCTIKPVTDWILQDPTRPFFATIWTGMTHYPYFPGEQSQDYSDNADFNRFLNAVRVGDAAFGALMEVLFAHDLADSTLVVVVGDHGEAFGEHGNFVHASALYEENIHVPLMLVNPQLFSGGTSDVIAGLSDISPTALDLLNIKSPPIWQGLSLYAKNRPDGVLFFAPWNGFQVGYRAGTRKFIYNINSEESWLFDLETDPAETTNLATASAADIVKAKDMLGNWINVQNTWTTQLLKGEDAAFTTVSASGISELVVHASGTRYLTAPRARISLDGDLIGEIEVIAAPSNAEVDATAEQIGWAVTEFRFPTPELHCAKQVTIEFLNDEWAGENLTGDTNLIVQRVGLAGTEYWPHQFQLATERAGGVEGDYFTLWRNGSLRVNLAVGPECIDRDLGSQ